MDAQAAINWDALKIVLRSDIRIWGALAAEADHGTAGNALRARYAAMIEQAQKTLDSMATIEQHVYVSSVPGLASHTAAACDTITKAATA